MVALALVFAVMVASFRFDPFHSSKDPITRIVPSRGAGVGRRGARTTRHLVAIIDHAAGKHIPAPCALVTVAQSHPAGRDAPSTPSAKVHPPMKSTSRPSKKKLLIASAALLSIGLTGSIATGAYFTDQKIVTDNQLTAGTVVLGNIADDPTSVTPVTFTNVLPIDDSTSAKIAANAKTFNVNVRNSGTAEIDWKATLSLTSSAFARQVRVSYSTDNGSTWSAPTFADNLNGVAINSTTALAANDTLPVKFRAWLPAATDNTAQGKSLTFSVTVNAIQAGAPWS